MGSVAPKIGCVPQTLNDRLRLQEFDAEVVLSPTHWLEHFQALQGRWHGLGVQ